MLPVKEAGKVASEDEDENRVLRREFQSGIEFLLREKKNLKARSTDHPLLNQV